MGVKQFLKHIECPKFVSFEEFVKGEGKAPCETMHTLYEARNIASRNNLSKEEQGCMRYTGGLIVGLYCLRNSKNCPNNQEHKPE